MNITQILSIVDYDMDKIAFFDYYGDQQLKAFSLMDFAGVGLFNTATTEVVYMYAVTADGECGWISDDYADSLNNFLDNYERVDQETILNLLYETYDKEADTSLEMEISDEDLKTIDAAAAKLDITRSAYVTKVLLDLVKQYE